MKATVNVLCYKSKTLSNGEKPLMICVCKDGKRKYQSIGVSVKAEHWDFEKNKPKNNCPNRELILKLVSDKISEFSEKILELKTTSKEFSANKLIESVNKPTKRKTVESLFHDVIAQMKQEKRIGNANFLKFALNSLISFNGNMEIPFTDIDNNWLKKYESWLRSKGNSENTLGIRFRALRVIYNRAIDDSIVKTEYYPFDKFKVGKLKESTPKRALTKRIIQKILEFDVTKLPNSSISLAELSKDVFLFSYLSCGINFIDIAHLKKVNLYDDTIVYSRHKTSKTIRVRLQPYAIELIKKYHNSNNVYLFPILDGSIHITEEQKHYRICKTIKTVNKWLKCIGASLKLSIPLTTYVARHSDFSFCLIMSNLQVNHFS